MRGGFTLGLKHSEPEEKRQPPVFEKSFSSNSKSNYDFYKLVDSLVAKVNELTLAMEKTSLAEYINLVHNPFRLIYVNLIAGIARGLGMAIGFALLGALLLYFLQKLVLLNLPFISSFIAEIVEMVNFQIRANRF